MTKWPAALPTCLIIKLRNVLVIAPFFHVYIIGSEMNFVKIVLSILGIIFVCILTIARIYRTFFYKE
ncbi:Uncharacterised protein [Streptococcus pneumoniae]|nr:Uncharacterised protein [Streptococcus pneumoniae]